MVTDTYLFIDEAVAVTTSKVGGNVINLKNVTDAAKGQPVFMNVIVDTTFTSAANELTVQLIASSGAVPGSSDVVMNLGKNIAASLLTKGTTIFRGALPEGIPYNYVNVYYLATTALAAGKVTTHLSIG